MTTDEKTWKCTDTNCTDACDACECTIMLVIVFGMDADY